MESEVKITEDDIGYLNKRFKSMGSVVSFELMEYQNGTQVGLIVVRDRFLIKNLAVALTNEFYAIFEKELAYLGIPSVHYNNTRTTFWAGY